MYKRPKHLKTIGDLAKALGVTPKAIRRREQRDRRTLPHATFVMPRSGSPQVLRGRKWRALHRLYTKWQIEWIVMWTDALGGYQCPVSAKLLEKISEAFVLRNVIRTLTDEERKELKEFGFDVGEQSWE